MKFLNTEDHVTLEDLIYLLQKQGYDYHPDFVRVCMNLWVDLGFAQKEQFEGQSPRYEHRHLGRHHDHLICTKCGSIREFRNEGMERLQIQIATGNGFHMLQHRMEIYGLCAECLTERSHSMPLAMGRPGERLMIKGIKGEGNARGRLTTMGIKQGDFLEVLKNDGRGRLIIGHGATRFALGRGVAHKIMVSLDQ